MNATAEIDKAGRLVIPKKIRDSLHLVPGTRVTFSQVGETIQIQTEAKPRGLYWDRGWPVLDSGLVPPSDAVEDVNRAREERMNFLIRNRDE